MPNLYITTRDGKSHEVQTEDGLSVMAAIRTSGIDDLLALCGGCCSCATCHVYVEGGELAMLPPMSDDEEALLEFLNHRRTTSRLSCQIPLRPALDGLRVTIAPED